MAPRQSRNVSLTPELEAFIAEQLASGDYANSSEVVRAALRSLRDGPAAGMRAVPAGWPPGNSDCGALIRAHDWSASPLGPIEGWSYELRATVGNIVNSPVAKVLMWGADHIMLYNDAYAPIIGERHPRGLGSRCATILPEVWDWNRPILEAGFRGESISHRGIAMTLDNAAGPQSYVFDLHYTPVHDAGGAVGGVMCTVVDVTAHVALENDLTASYRRFRTAMDAVHGVLWTNSPDGRMQGEQPGWAALTGQSYEEYQDFGWADAVHPDDQAESVTRWNEAVAAKAMFVHEHRVRERGGSWRTFAVRALPILTADGAIAEWVGVHTDITHRRAAERSLRQLNETLEAA